MKLRGRVLVVDDDPNQGVSEAKQKLSRQPFEVVVTDYEMPDGTGGDLLREMKSGKALVLLAWIKNGVTMARLNVATTNLQARNTKNP
ncbi:MAG: hypothetical protein ACAI25_16365 [Planctomycetota bacterium]